jgi:hypothetical protein
MDKSIFEILRYLLYTAYFISIVAGILKFNTLNPTLRVLFIFVTVSFIFDFCLTITSIYRINNFWIGNTYGIFEGILLFSLYYVALKEKKWIKTLPYVMLFYGFLCYIEWVFIQEPNKLLVISIIFESFILITLALMSFKVLLEKLDYEKPTQNPMFWVNTSVLLYFSGNLFIFTFGNIIHESNSILIYLWAVHNIIHILFILLFGVAFWKTTTR